MKAVNREAEIASLLISGFGVAFFGWALVHLASSPNSSVARALKYENTSRV